MISLIYVSTAAPTFDVDQLEPLAGQAAARNGTAGLTGLLAYNGIHFMQLLEGEETEVNATMTRIATDPRHSSLAIIRREERSVRECSTWAMRPMLTPLVGLGSARLLYDSLPNDLERDTRMLFTSFASLIPRAVA